MPLLTCIKQAPDPNRVSPVQHPAGSRPSRRMSRAPSRRHHRRAPPPAGVEPQPVGIKICPRRPTDIPPDFQPPPRPPPPPPARRPPASRTLAGLRDSSHPWTTLNALPPRRRAGRRRTPPAPRQARGLRPPAGHSFTGRHRPRRHHGHRHPSPSTRCTRRPRRMCPQPLKYRRRRHRTFGRCHFQHHHSTVCLLGNIPLRICI